MEPSTREECPGCLRAMLEADGRAAVLAVGAGHAGLLARSDAEAVRQTIGSAAVDVAQLLPEIRRPFADLPAPPNVDADSARFQLFDSITSFLLHAAACEPLVVAVGRSPRRRTPLPTYSCSSRRPDGGLRSCWFCGTYLVFALTPTARWRPAGGTRALFEPPVQRSTFVGLSRPTSPARCRCHRLPLHHGWSRRSSRLNSDSLFVGEAVELLAAEGEAAATVDPSPFRSGCRR